MKKSTKKELVSRIKVASRRIAEIQRNNISFYERYARNNLKRLFPQLTDIQIDDWLIDVLYNDRKNALKRMDKLFNKR